MKVKGRYGWFTPRPDHQSSFYAARAKRQVAQRKVRAATLQAWLDKHRSCANGCGRPVAFYDTVHYGLRFDGCCSSECLSALELQLNQQQPSDESEAAAAAPSDDPQDE